MFRKTQNRVKRETALESLNRRIDYARYLLIQTAEPLEVVAADCGWKCEATFAQVFKSTIGVTPKRYRDWHQG